MSQDDKHGSRRDFLYVTTGVAGAVAAGAAVWPLVNQMNPSADVQAQAQKEVDVSTLEPGTQLTVMFQGKPVFIRRQSEADMKSAEGVEIDGLIDPTAENPNIQADAPATIANRTIGESGEWLVMIGVCTHLGCIPLGDGAGDFNGWFCPCHGSHYDAVGRIRKGPAPENLHIPLASFIDENTLLLG